MESFNQPVMNPIVKTMVNPSWSISPLDFKESQHVVEVKFTNRLMALFFFYYKQNRINFWFNSVLLILRAIQDPFFGFINNYSDPLFQLMILFNPQLLKNDSTEKPENNITFITQFEQKKKEFDQSYSEMKSLTDQQKATNKELDQINNNIKKNEKNQKDPDTLVNIENLKQEKDRLTIIKTNNEVEIKNKNGELNQKEGAMNQTKNNLINAYKKSQALLNFLKNILIILSFISMIIMVIFFFKAMNKSTIKENLFVNVFGNFHQRKTKIWSLVYHISSLPLMILMVRFLLVDNEHFNKNLKNQWSTMPRYTSLADDQAKNDFIKKRQEEKDKILNFFIVGFLVYNLLNQIVLLKYMDEFLKKNKNQGSIVFYLIDGINEFKYQQQLKIEEEEFKAEQKLLAAAAKQKEKEAKARAKRELQLNQETKNKGKTMEQPKKNKTSKDKLLDNLMDTRGPVAPSAINMVENNSPQSVNNIDMKNDNNRIDVNGNYENNNPTFSENYDKGSYDNYGDPAINQNNYEGVQQYGDGQYNDQQGQYNNQTQYSDQGDQGQYNDQNQYTDQPDQGQYNPTSSDNYDNGPYDNYGDPAINQNNYEGVQQYDNGQNNDQGQYNDQLQYNDQGDQEQSGDQASNNYQGQYNDKEQYNGENFNNTSVDPSETPSSNDDNNDNQGNNSNGEVQNNGYYDPDNYNYSEGSSGSIYDNGGINNE